MALILPAVRSKRSDYLRSATLMRRGHESVGPTEGIFGPTAEETGARLPAEEPGLALFFWHGEPLADEQTTQIAAALETCGIEVLNVVDIDSPQMRAAECAVRQSYLWHGNLPPNYETPVTMFVGFDVMPATPTAEFLRGRPLLDNRRIMEAELSAPEGLRATDNSAEAWEFIRLLTPDDQAKLRSTIDLRKAEFATAFEVVRDLTRRGRRAKIELINYGGGLAVKKTFRRHCLRFLEREATFLESTSPERPEILPVVERGSNYLITPYIEAQPKRGFLLGLGYPKLMKLRDVRAASDLLRFLFARGYDPVDISPHNLLIDGSGSIKAIDFEFVYKGDGPIEPEHSACLNGIKDGFPGEWPDEGGWWLVDPYRARWFGHTALTRRSFLYDPAWLQSLKRFVNYPLYLAAKALQRVARRLWPNRAQPISLERAGGRETRATL
jgi:hypothetical protein